MGECALLKPAVSLIHAFTTSVPEHWKTFGQLYYRVDHPEPQQFQLADFNWRNNSHMFRLAMRCRLSARRSDSALPIAKVSIRSGSTLDGEENDTLGELSVTPRVVQKRIWRR